MILFDCLAFYCLLKKKGAKGRQADGYGEILVMAFDLFGFDASKIAEATAAVQAGVAVKYLIP